MRGPQPTPIDELRRPAPSQHEVDCAAAALLVETDPRRRRPALWLLLSAGCLWVSTLFMQLATACLRMHHLQVTRRWFTRFRRWLSKRGN